MTIVGGPRPRNASPFMRGFSAQVPESPGGRARRHRSAHAVGADL